MSLAGDHRSSKKDLKERISGIFKRGGSSSRAGSQEKTLNDSQQRPISIAANGSSTLPANFSMQQSQTASSSASPSKVKHCQTIFLFPANSLNYFLFLETTNSDQPAKTEANFNHEFNYTPSSQNIITFTRIIILSCTQNCFFRKLS